MKACHKVGRRAVLGAVVLLGMTAAARDVAAQSVVEAVDRASTVGALVEALFLPAVPFNPANQPLLTLADYQRASADSREGIAAGLGNALASFPLGASSAGFTYVVNTSTGERVLKALSFGPVFIDRAVTNGKGVLNMGLAYQGGAYDKLQGIDLKKDGFTTFSQLGTFAVDGSSIGDTNRALLDVSSHIGLFSGSYGVTDRLDVGWAVPFVSLSVRGKYLRDYNGGLDYDRNLIANGVPVRSVYPNKTGTATIADKTVDATGIGDIVLRAKYGLGAPTQQRVHVSGDLRLPTGDKDNLLGAGKATFRLTTGGSLPLGSSAALNANGGFSVGGLTNEANFSVGTEVALLPAKQLTMTLEFMGQNLRDTVTASTALVSFDGTLVNEAEGFLARRVTTRYGFWERGSTTLLRGAVGAKYAITGNWLLTGSALFRLNDNGYQSKIVPFVGLEHTWSTR